MGSVGEGKAEWTANPAQTTAFFGGGEGVLRDLPPGGKVISQGMAEHAGVDGYASIPVREMLTACLPASKEGPRQKTPGEA